MKIRIPVLDRVAGLACASFVRSWMGTVDARAAYYDPAVDPVHPDWHGQKIYIFWHEYILLPLSFRGHSNLVMLLSRHHDAEILSHVAGFMGFATVRGSTNRGGNAVARPIGQYGRSSRQYRAQAHRRIARRCVAFCGDHPAKQRNGDCPLRYGRLPSERPNLSWSGRHHDWAGRNVRPWPPGSA